MRSKSNVLTETSSAASNPAPKPTVLSQSTIPETSSRPNLGRHAAACRICHHPLREDIEQDFVDWRSRTKITKDYKLRDRSSLYRHAHALNLFRRRRRNVRVALEHIIEHAGDVDVNASAVVAAIQVYAKINARGEWVEPDEHLAFHDLFDRMSPEEQDAYAKEGTVPQWFQDAIAAAGAGSPRRTTMNRSTRNRRPPGPRPGDYPLGSRESRAAARAVLSAQDLEAQEQNDALRRNMTPLEKAFMETFFDPTAPPTEALAVICNAIEMKTKVFGMPAITPEYVRHRGRVLKEVAKIKQERAASGDTAFLNEHALEEMAEDRLRREDRRAAQTASTTARAAETKINYRSLIYTNMSYFNTREGADAAAESVASSVVLSLRLQSLIGFRLSGLLRSISAPAISIGS